MVQTPLTTATAYASAADLMVYHDERRVGDLVPVDDTRASPAAIAGSGIVTAHLLAASGRVEAACIAGARYTPADLSALTGAAAAMLKELVCHLAFMSLLARRHDTALADKDVALMTWTQDALERLRKGEWVFGTNEQAAASKLDTIDLRERSDGQKDRLTDTARRFFGSRSDDAF
jgi:hypothetical protein